MDLMCFQILPWFILPILKEPVFWKMCFEPIQLAGSDLEYVIRFSVWWRWCLRPWRACCLLTNGRGQCEQQVGQTELEDVILWKIEGKKASNVANRVEFVNLKRTCELFGFLGLQSLYSWNLFFDWRVNGIGFRSDTKGYQDLHTSKYGGFRY